jgi:hypothetical protein
MKLNEPKMFDILNKLLSKEKISALERQIIFQDRDGSYNLFGTYIIAKTDLGYVVEKKHTYTVHTFVDLKNAVTWSTLDKCGNVNGANRVVILDRQLSGTSQNMIVHENLYKRAKDADQQSLFLNKLNEGRVKKQAMTLEMNGFIERCKAWQYQQFAQNPAK